MQSETIHARPPLSDEDPPPQTKLTTVLVGSVVGLILVILAVAGLLLYYATDARPPVDRDDPGVVDPAIFDG